MCTATAGNVNADARLRGRDLDIGMGCGDACPGSGYTCGRTRLAQQTSAIVNTDICGKAGAE